MSNPTVRWGTLLDALTEGENQVRSVAAIGTVEKDFCEMSEDDLRSADKESLEAVRAAIKDYIQHQGWQDMSPETAYFARLRFQWAYWIVQALGMPAPSLDLDVYPIPPDQDQEKMLRWLLIDLWEQSGCHAWLNVFWKNPEAN